MLQRIKKLVLIFIVSGLAIQPLSGLALIRKNRPKPKTAATAATSPKAPQQAPAKPKSKISRNPSPTPTPRPTSRPTPAPTVKQPGTVESTLGWFHKKAHGIPTSPNPEQPGFFSHVGQFFTSTARFLTTPGQWIAEKLYGAAADQASSVIERKMESYSEQFTQNPTDFTPMTKVVALSTVREQLTNPFVTQFVGSKLSTLMGTVVAPRIINTFLRLESDGPEDITLDYSNPLLLKNEIAKRVLKKFNIVETDGEAHNIATSGMRWGQRGILAYTLVTNITLALSAIYELQYKNERGSVIDNLYSLVTLVQACASSYQQLMDHLKSVEGKAIATNETVDNITEKISSLAGWVKAALFAIKGAKWLYTMAKQSNGSGMPQPQQAPQGEQENVLELHKPLILRFFTQQCGRSERDAQALFHAMMHRDKKTFDEITAHHSIDQEELFANMQMLIELAKQPSDAGLPVAAYA